MKAAFADTFYFLALLNERDVAHDRAVIASRASGLVLVTTEFVLLELADAMCKPGQREEAMAIWQMVQTDPTFRLMQASTELMERGKELCRQRQDKQWSLTDCISFVVMQDEQLAEALTGDHHFEQAGFKPLLMYHNCKGDARQDESVRFLKLDHTGLGQQSMTYEGTRLRTLSGLGRLAACDTAG